MLEFLLKMSNSARGIHRGYLVLADISGYTAFLSTAELVHAQEILGDLLETIVENFRPLLVIHKIEGDAVFGYAADAQLRRGETLLELIEATYFQFRQRTRNVRRHTTCDCRACNNISTLDLKFIVHHGEFAMQNIGGRPELAGTDVNLAHRLLKNHVGEQTGWSAYALFSKAGLEHTGLQITGAMNGTEEYEHLGRVEVCALDLHQRYDTLMSQRREVVEEQDALVTFSEVIRATPPVLWSWMNDPVKRALYSSEPNGLKFVPVLRPGGRTGVGATTHCMHGRNTAMREIVLDWKPFNYYTVEQDGGAFGVARATFELQPVDADHTRVVGPLRGRFPGVPAFLGNPLFRFVYSRLVNYGSIVQNLKRLLEADAAAADSAPGAATPAPAAAG